MLLNPVACGAADLQPHMLYQTGFSFATSVAISAQIVRDAFLLHSGSASVACLIHHVAWRGTQ